MREKLVGIENKFLKENLAYSGSSIAYSNLSKPSTCHSIFIRNTLGFS